MNPEKYCKYDATGLSELVRNGDVSAKELAEFAVEGVVKVNPMLNAVIEVFRDRVDTLDESTIPSSIIRSLYPTQFSELIMVIALSTTVSTSCSS